MTARCVQRLKVGTYATGLGLLLAKASREVVYSSDILKVTSRRQRSWRWAGACLCAMFALALSLSTSVRADTVTLDYSAEFSNGTPPTGSPPWLEAVFSDVGQPANTVQLTLTAVNLSSTEFVSGWYFNLDPGLNPTSLTLTQPISPNYSAPIIQLGGNAFKADGDGKYDILISFATEGGVAQRFTAGDSITFTITGITGLTPGSFDFTSAPSGGHGPFFSAAHVQGISGGLSGWVDGTPGPGPIPQTPDGGSTIALLGSALLGMGILGSKLRRL